MTKKEKAQMQELRVLAALRWTDKSKPALIIADGQNFIEGWDFNEYRNAVFKAWTCNSFHGEGTYAEYKSSPAKVSSQGSIQLFETKEDAYKAMRNVMEKQFAEKLAAIDARILEINETA